MLRLEGGGSPPTFLSRLHKMRIPCRVVKHSLSQTHVGLAAVVTRFFGSQRSAISSLNVFCIHERRQRALCDICHKFLSGGQSLFPPLWHKVSCSCNLAGLPNWMHRAEQDTWAKPGTAAFTRLGWGHHITSGRGSHQRVWRTH